MNLEVEGIEVEKIPQAEALLERLPEESTLADYLKLLREDLMKDGYMLGVVEADGTLLIEGHDDKAATVAIEDVGRVRIHVAPTPLFVGQTFAECASAVDALAELRGDINSSVRSGKFSEASEGLADFTDGLSVLTSAYQDGLQVLAQLGLVSQVDAARCQENLRALGVTLRDVLQGVNMEDFVLISDALEYEFPEHLEELGSAFSNWSRELRTRNSDLEEDNDPQNLTEEVS
jgi:hypothetical protein